MIYKIITHYCLIFTLVAIIVHINQASTTEEPLNRESKCDTMLKKALEPIPDKETQERVQILLLNYIEDTKKTYKLIYTEARSKGVITLSEEFRRKMDTIKHQLEKNLQEIIKSNHLTRSSFQTLQRATDSLFRETLHLLDKLVNVLPEEFHELRRKYLTPITMSIVECHDEIARYGQH